MPPFRKKISNDKAVIITNNYCKSLYHISCYIDLSPRARDSCKEMLNDLFSLIFGTHWNPEILL